MMASMDHPASGTAREESPTHPAAPPTPAPSALQAPGPHPAAAPPRSWRRWVILGAVVVGLGAAGFYLAPVLATMLNTVSTDDAYVNGHVTFVAPRVPGQVVRVLVDDNNRVRKGNLLVQLDKVPYRVQVDIAQAALTVAQADLVAARAKVRGLAGLARSQRFDLAHSIEELHNQVADLHAKVAALHAADATLVKAQADYQREQQLLTHRVISQQVFDSYQETYSVAKAQSAKAQQEVYQ